MSRRVLVLAALVLVVGGILVFRELPILESERDRALADLLVFGEAPSVVDTVRIRQDDREILIVREPDSWYLRAPIEEAVPELQVLDLIERLKLTERWRGIATGLSEEEWETYGLGADSPGRSRIELIGEDGRVAVDVGLLTRGGHRGLRRARPASPRRSPNSRTGSGRTFAGTWRPTTRTAERARPWTSRRCASSTAGSGRRSARS